MHEHYPRQKGWPHSMRMASARDEEVEPSGALKCGSALGTPHIFLHSLPELL